MHKLFDNKPEEKQYDNNIAGKNSQLSGNFKGDAKRKIKQELIDEIEALG